LERTHRTETTPCSEWSHNVNLAWPCLAPNHPAGGWGRSWPEYDQLGGSAGPPIATWPRSGAFRGPGAMARGSLRVTQGLLRNAELTKPAEVSDAARGDPR